MKTVIISCLLAVICTANANSTSDIMETLKLQMRNAKWSISTIMQQLDHFRMQIEEDTLTSVTKKWNEYIQVHRSYINLLLTAMRNEVEAAKMKDANVQQCYDVNFLGISDTSITAYNDAAKCKEAAHSSIKNSFGFINSLTSTGHGLIAELDNVFLECYNRDSLRMQSCIVTELERINILTKTFENDTKFVDRAIQPISNYVILQADQCMNEIYMVARFNSEESKLSCSRCVSRILENV